MSAGSERKRWRERRSLVEQMWREGASCKEIAAAIGAKGFPSSVYRKHGYDLPYRYPVRDGKRIAA